MKTALITSDTYQNHNTGEGHPEKIGVGGLSFCLTQKPLTKFLDNRLKLEK